ncbi:MAG: hypothetical protein ACFB02_08700 [Mastigocoleus sp.]
MMVFSGCYGRSPYATPLERWYVIPAESDRKHFTSPIPIRFLKTILSE